MPHFFIVIVITVIIRDKAAPVHYIKGTGVEVWLHSFSTSALVAVNIFFQAPSALPLVIVFQYRSNRELNGRHDQSGRW